MPQRARCALYFRWPRSSEAINTTTHCSSHACMGIQYAPSVQLHARYGTVAVCVPRAALVPRPHRQARSSWASCAARQVTPTHTRPSTTRGRDAGMSVLLCLGSIRSLRSHFGPPLPPGPHS